MQLALYKIKFLRSGGQKVMLDFDLAEMYEVETKRWKQHNKNFKEIYHALNLLIENKTKQEEQANRELIGFKTNSKWNFLENSITAIMIPLKEAMKLQARLKILM